MSKRQLVVTCIAGFHLLLVACGAIQLPLFGETNPIGRGLRIYGALSGSDSGYGFFAPEVGPQLRAVLHLEDDQGRQWTDQLDDGLNAEAKLRMSGVVSMVGFPEYRDAIVTSLAAAMLGRHPTAKQVQVEVQVFDPPTMEDFRNGKRPQWESFFVSAPFYRQSDSEMSDQ